MPNWKKVLTSGSAGELASLYAPSITGSLLGTASYAIYAETASLSNSTTLTQVLALNQAGFTIPKGTVVRITGSNNASDIPRITTASYEDDGQSANTLGIMSQTTTNGSTGYVVTEGVLTGIDTTNYTSGTLIFLGPTGSITGSAPLAPLHAVRLGQVIRQQSNNGSIHVRVDNGYELDELHDVLETTTTSSYGDLFIKSGSVWTNSRQLTGSYGLTGSLSATSFTGSLFGTASWSSNSISASFASTASSVNPLNQNVVITGSLVVSASGTTNDLRIGTNKLIISGSQVTIGKSLTNGAQNVIDTAYRISATGSISTVDTVYGGNTTLINLPGYGISGNGTLAGGRFGGASDGGAYGIYATTADAGGSVSADFIAGYFEASSLSTNYSLQLVDGTQGFGKVLVSQTSTGKAQWGTRLSGSYEITGSLIVTTSITGSLFGTSSWANNVVTASFARTASYVNTLNQNVLITGSLTVGTSSVGANENTLIIGPAPAGGTGEGGQLLLQAVGGTYTSASMLDNWQNQTRLLRGTNASSDAVVAQWNMHTKQMQLPAYNSTTAFTSTPLVGILGFDANGNILTTNTSSGGGGGGVTITNNTDNYLITATGTANTLNGESNLQFNGSSLTVTGQITSSGAIISQANGAMYFRGGDDAEFWDINVTNTVGIYGQQDATVGSIKLGSGGGILSGWSSSIGIGTVLPNSGTLHVNGNVFATSFTGSLRGTSSWASNAVTASFVTTAQTASYVLQAVSSSFASSASFVATSSWANNAVTASYIVTAQTASYVLNAVSASFASTASFLNSTTNAFIQGGNSFGTTATLGTNDSQNLALETNNVARITIISSSGLVGIGTPTPSTRLHVSSNGNIFTLEGTDHVYQQFYPQGIAAGRFAYIGFSSSGSNQMRIYNESGTGDLILGTVATPRIFISASGNVGVGIITPSASLHINNTTTANSFLVEDDTNPDSSPFVIDNTGKVGVGVTAPSAKFEIKSSAYSNLGGLLLRSSTSNNYPALLYETTNEMGVLELYSGSSFTTRIIASGSSYFNGGNVGIGTASPTARLDVSGSTIITGSLNVSAGITGSLFGTASWAQNAVTASFITTAQTASYVLNAISSSYALTASYVANASSFPYTGSAQITGSLGVTGSVSITQNITGSRMYLSSSNGTLSGSTLVVYGSGSTNPVFTVQGSQGELFSVTDTFSGSLFSVNDISGLPVLEAFSNSTVVLGDFQAPALYTTKRVITTATSFTVFNGVPTASYDGAWFEYTAKSGSNARAGQIMAIWSSTSINFTETTTTDFGSTSDLSLTVIVSGSNIALTGSSTNTGWTIKTIVRSI